MIEKQPRRPVTPSLASANAEFNHWVAENAYSSQTDAKGCTWQIESRIDRYPHPERLQGTLFKHIIQLSTAISADSLLKAGILSSVEDQRLLVLLGDEQIPVRIERVLHTADSIEKLREKFAEDIVKIKEFLKTKDFSQAFRALVGKFVSGRRLMTYRLTQEPQSKINLEF